MKKHLTIVFSILLIISLAACGGQSSAESQKTDDISSSGSNDKEVENTGKQDASIDEAVLVDEAGIKITAKSLDNNGLFGPEIKMLIENDSGQDLTFQCRNASVNGYMIETMMSSDVVSGKKANDSLTFMSSDLKACGIQTIADMEFSFHIFTIEGWETYLDTPQIQIKTSMADTYKYTFDDSGNLVYDGNGIKIAVKGLTEDSSILGPGIIIYTENSSGKDITVQARDVSVNGFMMDPIFSSDIVNDKHAINTITFMTSELEENEITVIETVELSFHIFEADSWDTIIDTDVVTLTF